VVGACASHHLQHFQYCCHVIKHERQLVAEELVVLLIAIAIVVAAYVATLFITQLVTSSMNDDLPSQGNLLGKWYVMFQYGDFIDCPFSSIEFPAVDGGDMKILCYKSNSYLDTGDAD
jgi:hypothetical protein